MVIKKILTTWDVSRPDLLSANAASVCRHDVCRTLLTVGMYSAVQLGALHHYRAHNITIHYIHDWDWSHLIRSKTGRAPLRMAVERFGLVSFSWMQLEERFLSSSDTGRSLQLSCRVLQSTICNAAWSLSPTFRYPQTSYTADIAESTYNLASFIQLFDEKIIINVFVLIFLEGFLKRQNCIMYVYC